MLIHADCLEALRNLPDNSVDSVVTDPPYGLSFMGKKWDYDVPSVDIWLECFRVLKPGGYLLSFAGTRTQHRIACGIEDAGFEIRDMIAWVYGSGFPKSLDVGKAIDKMLGNERDNIGANPNQRPNSNPDLYTINGNKSFSLTRGNSPYEGYGTALKPALEPITVARKPIEGTVAANVLKWGTGAINIDGCRVESGSDYHELSVTQGGDHFSVGSTDKTRGNKFIPKQGRFPANLIHDGSDEVLELTGSAARFFYCAKASKAERNMGCEGLPITGNRPLGISSWENQTNGSGNVMGKSEPMQNHHPTVKPLALMRYLVRLVTPPNGTVLDPFLGSGTTAIAAIQEGFDWIGVEREAEYCDIAEARIAAAEPQQIEVAL